MGQNQGKVTHSDYKQDCQAHSGPKGHELDFAHILNTVGQGVLVTGKEWRFEYVNPAFARLVGRHIEDLVGKSMDDIVIPEDLPTLFEMRSKRLAGETNTYHLCLRRSDGEIVYVLATGAPRRLGDKVIGSISIITDLTEQKNIEMALKAERDRAEKYLNIAEVILVVLDTDARITLLNRKGYQILGYEERELIGKNWIKTCLRPEDHESVLITNNRISAGEIKPFEYYENYVLTKKGEERHISWHTTVLRDDNGSIIGTLSSGEDITERKRTEEALQESKDYLNHIINSMGDPIFVKDRQHRLILVNEAACKQLGRSPQEIIGQTTYDLFLTKGNADVSWEKDEEVFDTGRENVNEETITFAPGVSRTGLVKKTLYKDNAGNQFLVGVIRDITERKKTELKLARELNTFKVLYDLTLDMSAEKRLEENFAFIVNKSRELLNADTSYIALLDEKAQDVRMHTLSGIRTEAFKQMHLPLSKGLYGLVMETHQGYIIDDYFKNRDIKHVVDQVIADEGLVSGMAVPIQIKDLSLGVLYVFNRYKTQFTQEDLDTLALLGNLAAVEIIRKKSSNALREQLNFSQQLIDAMPNPIFYKNAKGVYLGCNKAFETSTGLTKEKIVGKTVYELYDKDLADIYYEADNKLFQNPGVQVYEASIINANGTRNNVMFNKATYINSEGRIAGLVGVMLDITERKQMEIALRESERRLADIINFLPDATMVIDKEGKVIAWNRAIEFLTGVKPERMLGKGNHEHALPFYGQRRPILIDLVLKPQEEIEESYSNMKREGDSLVGEAYMPMLGGGETYLWGVASALYDSQGDIVGAIESIKDITDRKRAEEALKESERHLADIINFLPDPTMVIDKNGKVISWNLAIEDMTGVKAVDILGRGDYEYAIPFYGQRRPVLIDLVLKSQEEFEITYDDIERKDGTLMGEAYMPNLRGSEAYLFGTAAGLYDSKGNIIGAIESVRDITETKKAEEALLKSERSYRLLAENVTDVIWTMDMDLKFTYISPSNVRMTGFSVEEAMALKLEDILTPISLESVNRVLAEELEIEKMQQKDLSRSRTIEVEEYCKGGHITWVEIRAAFLRDENGRPVGIQGISREITERKRAEEELQESKEYLNQIINSIGDPIFAKDREHRFVLVNNALCALTGRSQEELLGMTDYDFFPQHQAAIFWQLDDKVFESGEENVNEEAITGVDDDVHTIITKKTLFTDRFGNKQIVGVIRDISERKRMEEELCRSRDELVQRVKDRTAELETKNTEMERFIYTVSHDLRAPLISVSGFLGFLKQDAERGDLKRLDADLQKIADSVTRMDNLLMDTLQLSRIGRVINPPTDIPFREIVEEALKQTAQKINSKGIKVSVALDMSVVRVDRMRIAEVLINLLENSIKYMGPADKPEINIGYRPDGKEPVFFIRDNGIGIDPSQHRKIFELFYKVNKNSEGTGAGLAIVKRIIEVHGGRIWVESELGNGCTVCFTLASPQTEDQVT